MNRKRWTNEEEQVIISQVKETPNNLQEAFFKASKLINRTPQAISYRWYIYIRRSDTPVFMLASSNKHTINSKIGGDTLKHSSSIWYRMKKLLHLI